MCKKLLCLALVLLVFLSGLALPVRAEEEEPSVNGRWENATDIKNTGITDSLSQIDSVHWYRFTLENPSQAVVRLTSDEDDQIAYYYWKIVLYRLQDNGEEPLKRIVSQDVGGGSQKTDFLIWDQEPGEYFLCVESYAEGTPGASSDCYTNAPYTISVITEGYAPATGDALRTTVSKAGEIIAVIGGKVYIKRYDGTAYVGYYVDKDLKTGVFLMSDESADAVEYYTPQITDRMWQIDKLEYQGKTYYYVPYLRDAYEGITSVPALHKCSGNEGKAAANDLLKLHFGSSSAEEEEAAEQEEDKKGSFWAYIVIAGIVVIGVLGAVFIPRLSRSSYRGGSSGSYGGSGSDDRAPTEQDLRNMVDDEIANKIAENSHNPNYDPEGFSRGPGPEDFNYDPEGGSNGPGPEDFPTSDSIW